MNIAIFASAFYPHFGGVEELCRQLALELKWQGHEAIVLTNRWPRSLPASEVIEGIAVYRVPFRTPDAGLKSKVSYWATRGAVERRVRGILRRHSIELLHVQCVSCNGYYALRASRALGLGLIVTLQGELTMDASGLFERSAFARQTLRDCMADARCVTACSRQTLEDGERFLGKPLGSRGQVIFNGVNTAEFESAKPFVHGRPYILAIGRHVPQKGFDVLLRATALAIKDSTVEQDLILAGDGPEREKLERLAEELGIRERVTFPGRVDHEAAVGLFAGCDFFVLPSRHEPFGIVNLEAMAAGKAVIATRSGGAPEAVLDRITGIIVEKENVAELGAAIGELARDSQRRQRLGEAGKRRSEQFAWLVIVGQYLARYEECVGSAALGESSGRVDSLSELQAHGA